MVNNPQITSFKFSLTGPLADWGLQNFARIGPHKERRKNDFEKNAKVNDFSLPKTSRNLVKMPSNSHFPKTCAFSTIFYKFGLFVALCTLAAKCLKPNKNCGFVALRAYQHCVFVGT